MDTTHKLEVENREVKAKFQNHLRAHQVVLGQLLSDVESNLDLKNEPRSITTNKEIEETEAEETPMLRDVSNIQKMPAQPSDKAWKTSRD